MKISLRQLQVFVSVAEQGSTMAAANAVALSQSAASAALNELEHMLNTQLFDRVGKRLLLNDNGRLLMPQARLILDAANSIELQFSSGGANWSCIRIGASTTIGSYCLPALLAASPVTDSQLTAFARHTMSHPQMTIANTADIVSAVANYEVDFGFIEGPCHRADLLVEPWFEDEMVIVCSPEHPYAAQKNGSIGIRELRSASWLLREHGSGTRENVEQVLLPHLKNLKLAGEFGTSEAIMHAAAAGLGIACLSRVVVADLLALGKLHELETKLPPLKRHFYLIYSPHKLLSRHIQDFLQFCRAWRPE